MGTDAPLPRRWRLAVAHAFLFWAAIAQGQSSSASLDSPLDASPASGLKISIDGTCGGTTGLTCAGSSRGTCCSAHGYCGTGDTYCGKGCDLTAGTCNPGQGTTPSVGPPLPSGTQREGPNPSCPQCPVCTICISPTPSVIPSSCRVILTATRWETATTTVTAVLNATPTSNTKASGANDVEEGQTCATVATTMTTTTTTTATMTMAATFTKTTTVTTATDRSVAYTKTVTQIQTETLIRTETVTLSGGADTVVGTAVVVPPAPADQDKPPQVPPTPASSASSDSPASAVIIQSGPTPSPILPGMVPGCRRWYKTQDGDTCGSVSDTTNISKDDLRFWNTRIGGNTDDTVICEAGKLAMLASNLCRLRCGDLWAGFYVCVGV